MLTPYVYSDFNKPDPNNPTGWWGETVIKLVYQRGDIATDVKKAVDAFGDGSGKGSYKHFVPWERIFRAVEDACGGKTRNECHTLLTNVMAFLGVKDASGVDPTQSKIDYNTWFSWAFDAICDWPANLFRGESHGDHKGTALDMPIDYSDALKQRLDAARHKLRDAIGINIDYQQSYM